MGWQWTLKEETMKSEKLNKILRVTLPLAGISIIIMSIMKGSWVQLLMLPIILLAWYNSYQPVDNKTDNTD